MERADTQRLLILGGLSAIGPVSIDMYLPALPELARDLDASASMAQLTVTACIVGLAVGQVLTGAISDRHGRRGPLLIFTALYAAASVLCAVAPGIELLIVARLLQGLAGSAGIVIARAIVRDVYEGDKAQRFFALLISTTSIAPVVAPLIGAQLLHATSWRGIFAVISALAVLLLVGVFLAVSETLPVQERHGGGIRHSARIFGELVGDRQFVGYTLSAGLAFAAMFSYIAGSPFVLQENFGLSPQAFSVVFATNGLGIVAMGQLSGHLAGRVPARTVLRAGLTVSLTGATTLLVAVLADAGLWAVLPSLFLVVSSIGLIMPNASMLALAGWPPAVAGSASALLGLVQFVFGGAASPLVGIAGPETAVPMAVLIAVLSGSAMLAYASTSRPARLEPCPGQAP